MSERIKFDFDSAVSLVNSLTSCMDILEAENEKLQNQFDILSADFRDAYYDEFAVEFKKGDRCVREMKGVIRDLSIGLLKYAREMGAL